ncbi:MAG: DUF4007 family protein [Bacteroidota bacterium]
MEITAKKVAKYTFSGHDTFQCRHFWLKKGFDLINSGKSFGMEDAVVELGVGKNMVSAIKYWMKAFDLMTNDEKPTPFAERLLNDNGWDPYLEDEGSLWLLHYHLVKKGLATSYDLIFNEFRREKIEFTKSSYLSFLKRKAEQTGAFQVNEKTITDDFGVLIKMYIRSDAQSKDKEDTLSGLFTELDLVKSVGRRGDEVFSIDNTEKNDIPAELILYAIINMDDFDTSINLNTIENEQNSVGSIFAINRTGLTNKIEALIKKHDYITYSNHAGIRELQFKKKPDLLEILNSYYAN